MWKKILFILFCVVYGTALIGILLVVRFPKDRFLSYAEETVEQHLQGFSCSIKDASYRFPLHLDFDRIQLTNQDELINVSLERVRLSFDQKNPARRIQVEFDIYGGTVQVDMVLDNSTGFVELPSLTLTDIDLGSVEPLQQRLARPIEGTLHLSGRYRAHREYLGKGTFDGKTRVNDLQLDLRRPILQSNTVVFDTVSAEISLSDGQLKFGAGQARGPSFTGNFSGEISIAGQWQESTLSVSGTLLPRDNYVKENQQVARAVELLYKKYGTREIPYRVDGSIREPQFQFGPTDQNVL